MAGVGEGQREQEKLYDVEVLGFSTLTVKYDKQRVYDYLGLKPDQDVQDSRSYRTDLFEFITDKKVNPLAESTGDFTPMRDSFEIDDLIVDGDQVEIDFRLTGSINYTVKDLAGQNDKVIDQVKNMLAMAKTGSLFEDLFDTDAITIEVVDVRDVERQQTVSRSR